jgi:hypothetical protein
MDDKTAKDLVKQLTRIADALDKQNVIEENKLKRDAKINKLQEKKLRSDLRESVNVDPEQVIKLGPRIGSEG